VAFLQEFVSGWDDKRQPRFSVSLDRSDESQLVYEIKPRQEILLVAEHGMCKTWFGLYDLKGRSLGLLRGPDSPGLADTDYGLALEHFLERMGLFEGPEGRECKAHIVTVDKAANAIVISIP
jgi:hypothetical protein